MSETTTITTSSILQKRFLQQSDFVVAESGTDGNPSFRIPFKEVKRERLLLLRHRQQLTCEIIIEIDGRDLGHSREVYFEMVKPLLLKKGVGFEAWTTQSKSVHIHAFFDREISKEERRAWFEQTLGSQLLAEKVLRKNADGVDKVGFLIDPAYYETPTHLVALEGMIHYISGKEKILIESFGPEKNEFKLEKPVPQSEFGEMTPRKRKVEKTILQILTESNPGETERGSLVMQLFAMHPAWTSQEYLNYIEQNQKWSDFNREKTLDGITRFLGAYANKPNPRKGTPFFGVQTFNRLQSIEVRELVTCVTRTQTKHDSVDVQHLYRIFEFSFGSGKLDQKSFLIAGPNETKNRGSNEIFLRPAILLDEKIEFLGDKPPEKEVLKYICKERKIATYEEKDGEKKYFDTKTLLAKITERQQKFPLLFVETTGIPENEAVKITNEQWQELLSDYLTEKTKKDPRIISSYKSDLAIPNPHKIRPKQFMPYSSNEIIAVNSKTGKSTLASKTGILIERGTPANLLGFSTANEKVEGSLNNQTKTVTIDEIQESKNEAGYSALSSYMERGETETRTGKAVVNVRGLAPIRWQGNPKANKDLDLQYQEEEVFERLVNMLKLISTNNQAFGGRLAALLFRFDLQSVDTNQRMPSADVEKNAAIVETVMFYVRDNFTELFFNETVLDWLNKPLSPGYTEALKKIEEKMALLSLKELVEGHRTLAKKHVRGKALRLAFVDFAIMAMTGKLQIVELLEAADEYLAQIENQNLESFSNLVSAASRESISTEFVKKAFDSASKHLKLVLNAIRNAWAAEPNRLDFLFGELEFPPKEITGYSDARILERLTANSFKTERSLSQFGIEMSGLEKGLTLKIAKPTVWAALWGNQKNE